MKFYAEPKTSNQIIEESSNPQCPDGYIEMIEPRQSNEHIAQEDGTWLYVEPVKEILPITKRQAMLQLDNIGLYDDLLEFINQTENKILKIEFEYSSSFERDSPVILGMAKQFHLSDEQVDNLFTEAATL